MKTVFSNSEDLVHAFAQKTQMTGRNSSGNLYFQKHHYTDSFGTVCYSYGSHYELSRFLDDNTILINNDGYSSSTSKHIHIMIGATRQYKQYFTKGADLTNVYISIKENVRALANARKPEMYILSILSLWESLNEFAEYDRKRLKIAKSKFNTYCNGKYKELKSIVKAIENDSENYKEKLSMQAKKQAAKERADQKKAIKVSLSKFMNYEIDYFRVNEFDYLRISKDGKNVETSQRVKVSINESKLLYALIKRGSDVKGYRVDGYTVNSINGTLKIGCHNIDMNSVKTVGEKVLKM